MGTKKVFNKIILLLIISFLSCASKQTLKNEIGKPRPIPIPRLYNFECRTTPDTILLLVKTLFEKKGIFGTVDATHGYYCVYSTMIPFKGPVKGLLVKTQWIGRYQYMVEISADVNNADHSILTIYTETEIKHPDSSFITWNKCECSDRDSSLVNELKNEIARSGVCQ